MITIYETWGRVLLLQNVYLNAYLKYVKKRCIMKQRITLTVDSYQLLKAYDVNNSGAEVASFI